MFNIIYFVMLVVILELGQADPSKLPTAISPTLLGNNESMGTCISEDMIDQQIEKTKDYLNKNPQFRPCGCGSSAWTRVALYNSTREHITDPNTQQVISGCISYYNYQPTITVLLPVNGVNYYKICGREY